MVKTTVSIIRNSEPGYRLPYTVTLYRGAECIKKVACDTLAGAREIAKKLRAESKSWQE